MRDRNAPLIEHLEELRKRLLICAASVLTCGVVCYFYIESILSLFTKFLDKIVFIAPQEAFVTYIKLSFFGGVVLASPVILFHAWRFIERAFTPGERQHCLIYTLCSFLLFISGVCFCYFLILPWAITFLLSFQTEKITPMITLSNFTTFSAALLLTFGLVFELPVVIVFLSKINLVTPHFLIKRRKYVILMIFMASAVLTPPDAVTQIMLALPLMVLYEIGVLLSRLVVRQKRWKG